MRVLYAGCTKLGIESDNLKLYTNDGVQLFDDDIQDESFMEGQTILLAAEMPPVDVTPPPPKLTRQGTDDTLSSTDLEVEMLSDLDVTPKSSQSAPTKLPTFSNFLHTQLQKCGNKACDSELWKRVSSQTKFKPY